MVAKSYQNMKQLGVPYKDNGKSYVRVMTQKGVEKVVRWYTKSEYARMYPEDKRDVTKDPYYKPQKIVLGFEKEYITIFKGVTAENEEWFYNEGVCRFARYWGWYVISTQEVPSDLPEGVSTIKLNWETVGSSDGKLKAEAEVVKNVHALMADKGNSVLTNTKSEPQGAIGDRLERDVVVIDRKAFETQYGKTYEYDLEDDKGNIYYWKTSAQNWLPGTKHKIRGTVKAHKDNITILTRCMEVTR